MAGLGYRRPRLIGDRFESVEILRGIAALAVAWFHFSNGTSLLPDGWLKASGSYGWTGVDVFFVISGFVIPYAMHRARFMYPADCGRFVLKRVLRLEPPYLVAIAISVGLWFASAMAPDFRGTQPQVTSTSVLLHFGYLVDIFGYRWLNSVFWSLAIEFQFYLLAAIAFPVFVHPVNCVRWLSLGIFCGLAYLIPDRVWVFHYAGLFALGILTFQKVAGFLDARFFIVSASVVAAISMWFLELPSVVVGVATAMLIAFVQSMPRIAPLTFLGTLSYSLYLMHVPIGGRVVNLGTRFADTLVLQIAVITAALVVSLLAAYLFYRLIERPSKRWSSLVRYGYAKYTDQK